MGYPLNNPVICIVGPTASGKTALAQALAEKLNAAVLSADSMQVYTGMDIGTGKIPLAQRSVDYYGLDLVAPNEPYSAALFQDYGRRIIEECDSEGLRTIVCGGTGFYVRALIDHFEFPDGEQVGNEVRDFYTQMFNEQGGQAVWDVLNELDAESASIIPPNDTKRVIRALELHSDGVSYAEQKEKFAHIEPFYPSIHIGLAVDPEVLNGRINARVDAMIDAGLLDEVRSLLDQGYKDAITSMQAIGYKEFVDYLDGRESLDGAIESVKLATRRYAKRQRTWFRKDTRIHWLDATDFQLDHLCALSLQIVEGGVHE